MSTSNIARSHEQRRSGARSPALNVIMSHDPRSRLKLELFKTRASFSFGRFTLASGKESSYYVNSKKALFNGEAIALLAEVIYDLTPRSRCASGRRSGSWRAIPIAAAVAPAASSGRPADGGLLRAQASQGARQSGAHRGRSSIRRAGVGGRGCGDNRRIGASGDWRSGKSRRQMSLAVVVPSSIDLEGGAEHVWPNTTFVQFSRSAILAFEPAGGCDVIKRIRSERLLLFQHVESLNSDVSVGWDIECERHFRSLPRTRRSRERSCSGKSPAAFLGRTPLLGLRTETPSIRRILSPSFSPARSAAFPFVTFITVG